MQPTPQHPQLAQGYNAPLHWTALVLCIATFPLIFLGGLVTSHQAGMSVPDWPNSYGYNMFLFPPRFWVGGILYEHTHRLYASFVGVLSIILTAVAFLTDKRRSIRLLAASTLSMVLIQGILGGLRVRLIKLDLAIVHACVAQAFFCLTALVVLVTSRWWNDASTAKSAGVPTKSLARLAFFATAIIFVQLIAGAVMRHYQAGLAIPDFPLSYGQILPPNSDHALASANNFRIHTLDMDPVSLAQIWLHFAHRIGAILVTLLVAAVVTRVAFRHRENKALFRPAIFLIALILTQLTLGALTVLLRKPADIASAHVAVGALVLVTTFVLAVRANHLAALAVTLQPSKLSTQDRQHADYPKEGFRPLSA